MCDHDFKYQLPFGLQSLKFQKALAVATNVINSATTTVTLFSEFPIYGHRGYRRKTRRYKAKIAIVKAKLGLEILITAIRNDRIMSAPIPKFPHGGVFAGPTDP